MGCGALTGLSDARGPVTQGGTPPQSELARGPGARGNPPPAPAGRQVCRRHGPQDFFRCFSAARRGRSHRGRAGRPALLWAGDGAAPPKNQRTKAQGGPVLQTCRPAGASHTGKPLRTARQPRAGSNCRPRLAAVPAPRRHGSELVGQSAISWVTRRPYQNDSQDSIPSGLGHGADLPVCRWPGPWWWRGAGLKFTEADGRLSGVREWSSADVASRRFVLKAAPGSGG